MPALYINDWYLYHKNAIRFCMMLVHKSDLGNHEKKTFDKVFVEILLITQLPKLYEKKKLCYSTPWYFIIIIRINTATGFQKAKSIASVMGHMLDNSTCLHKIKNLQSWAKWMGINKILTGTSILTSIRNFSKGWYFLVNEAFKKDWIQSSNHHGE